MNLLGKLKLGVLSLALSLGLFGCGGNENSDPSKFTTVGQGPTVIYINNQSTFSNTRLNTILGAINNQLQKDLKPVWGIDATLIVGNGSRQLTIVEDFAVSFPRFKGLATGFHTSGSVAYVGLADCDDEKVFSITISHEILEMLANPNAIRTSYEICDPVGSRLYGYTHDEYADVVVSDFVFPNFYLQGASGPYDYYGVIKAPLSPAPGHNVFDWLPAKLREFRKK